MFLKRAALISVVCLPLSLGGCSQDMQTIGSSSPAIADEETRELEFYDYRFVYFDDCSGVLYSNLIDEILYRTVDCSFKPSGLDSLSTNSSLIDVVEGIGFPSFLGISSVRSLDFYGAESGFYRVTFSEDMQYESVVPLDYENPSSWLDPAKKDLPTLKDIEQLEIGMSLDEVVSLIGKAQSSVYYGAIGYAFAVEGGYTLVTSWNPGEYDGKNGPYFLARMEIV